MIAYLEIETENLRLGVSPEVVEKDYHLDWYLAGLGIEKLFPQFSFYGGTAVKKLYLPNHRFSEDLDFISGGRLTTEEIRRRLERLHEFLQKEANLFYSYEPEEIEAQGTQTRFLIHYRGFSEIGGMKRFLLDFSQGIEALPKAIAKKLLTPYRDLKNRTLRIRSLPLEAICADKLALIVDRKRKEPRDIYDLWAVLTQVKKFDRKLFLSRFYQTLSYRTDLRVITGSLKDFAFKKGWEIRLRHQVPHLPDFEVVLWELTKKLKTLVRN